VLALFTDGVVGAMNGRGEEYGRGRLEDGLRGAAPDDDAEALREAVLRDVRGFAGEPQFFADDLTMIVLRRGAWVYPVSDSPSIPSPIRFRRAGWRVGRAGRFFAPPG
jgi:hypothetical protein